jgi:formylglycine-generating enzyme required for sulfatase activity
MVDVGVACIDRYEAPNKKGEKPILMQSSADGEKWCSERGKRLCNEDEWVRACKGPKGLRYPYGGKFESGRCNDVGKFIAPSWKVLGGWPNDAAKTEVSRLDQSEPSGTREGCVSAEGVHDLTGNVAEWVVRTRQNETNYSHVVKGCFWGRCFRVPHEPECDYVNFAHPAGFRSYEMGIRCCKAKEKAP